MGDYKIFHSSRFDKELSKSDKYFLERLDKIEGQLVINPFAGDPIKVKWFREKRIDKYRVYFLVYDDVRSVFMVAISEKKDQQQVINTIWLFLDLFRKELETMLD